MTTEQIIILVLGALCFILIAGILTLISRRKKKVNGDVASDVEIKKNVRYSTDEVTFTPNGELNVSYIKGDILIGVNQSVIADKNSQLKPGKYTILASNEDMEVFNVRVGGFVREFSHGTEIVLAEGETICPVSTSIILR